MKVIAESAFNHQGSFENLKELARISKESGADYFTAQVMNVDAFCTLDYGKHELYKVTEFSSAQWNSLFDYCTEIALPVIPCVLDEESLKLCIEYGFKLLKLHATDITNKPLLEKISNYKDVRVILETQCATVFEIEFAIAILGENKIEALFSGYSNYPSEVEELNLNVLDFFKESYNFDIGFADHSLDTDHIPLMLLAKGCKYIEKHITASRNNTQYDWQVSLYPHEFSMMVHTIKHYTLALGNGVKHPSVNEKIFRPIMYKKIIENGSTLKRANKGSYFIENEIDSFDKNHVIVALVARLKSQRLPKKVMLYFHENELIVDLYNRLKNADEVRKVVLATSDLEEDAPLVDLFVSKGFPYFQGNAVSVIDRMLSLAFKEKAASIYRVTGDNPFTDPELLDRMSRLMKENNLDYVKVNNAPFGVGAELFSTKYLWKLYLDIENPMFSEYLTWYVLNDETVKMGTVDLDLKSNYELVNLSVDYEEDHIRCQEILSNIGKKSFVEITLKDINDHLEGTETVDDSKVIKLPQGQSIKLRDYIDAFKAKECVVKDKITNL